MALIFGYPGQIIVMNNSQDKFALNKRPDVVIDNLFDRILIRSDHTLGCINDHITTRFHNHFISEGRVR